MAYNPYNPFSWNAQNNPAYNFGQGLYNFTHAPFNETFQKGVDTHIGNVNQTNTRANQLLKEIQGNQTQNTGGKFSLFSHANAAPINNTELEKGMTLGNRYSADGLEFEGGLPRGQNTDDILYNMERIIANNEFKERPGIHFDNAPIENILNRRNNPRFGPIDMWKNQGGDETTGFKFPSILNMVTEGLGKFRDKFLPTMSPEKQAEVAALGINPDKYGWGTLPGSGLKGQIHNDKVYVENPFGGNLLHNKNLQSAFGSNSIAEMLQKKEDWAGGQFEKYGDTWTDKDHKGISEALYNYYKSTGALQNWQKAAINEPVVDTTAVDNMIIDGSTATPGGSQDISHYDPSAGGASHMTRSQSQGGLGLTQSEAQSISDANRAAGMSGWGLARGGRVSYFDGGLAGLL